jgi:transcriptional regulator with AAA-type ATPase domain
MKIMGIIEDQLEKIKFDLDDALIGNDKKIEEIKKLISLAADNDEPVLLIGETGVGKDVVANAIHMLSNHRIHRYYSRNCSLFNNQQLVNSELFGHAKGAFTGATVDKVGLFEAAKLGTLFLDELESMSLDSQAKILTVLHDGIIQRVGSNTDISVKTRIIAAIKDEIESLPEQNKIRTDLYYRLCVQVIKIPPLRERNSDIHLLANHFLELHSNLNKSGETVPTFSNGSLLDFYGWPGNVRELESVIKRSLIQYNGNDLIIAWNEKQKKAIESISQNNSKIDEKQDLTELTKERLCGIKFLEFCIKYFAGDKNNIKLTEVLIEWIEVNDNNPKLIVDQCKWLRKKRKQSVFKVMIKKGSGFINEIEDKYQNRSNDFLKVGKDRGVLAQDNFDITRNSNNVSYLESIDKKKNTVYSATEIISSEELEAGGETFNGIQFSEKIAFDKQSILELSESLARYPFETKKLNNEPKTILSYLYAILEPVQYARIGRVSPPIVSNINKIEALKQIETFQKILSVDDVGAQLFAFGDRGYYFLTSFCDQLNSLINYVDKEPLLLCPKLQSHLKFRYWFYNLERLFLFILARGVVSKERGEDALRLFGIKGEQGHYKQRQRDLEWLTGKIGELQDLTKIMNEDIEKLKILDIAYFM